MWEPRIQISIVRDKFKRYANIVCMAALLCYVVQPCWANDTRNSAKSTSTARNLRIGYFNGFKVDDGIEKMHESPNAHYLHICPPDDHEWMEKLKKEDPEKYETVLASKVERLKRILQARAHRFQVVANEVALSEHLDLVVDESGVNYGKDWLLTHGTDVTQQMIASFRKHKLEFDSQTEKL